jgi:hypothetical protein
LGLGSTLAVGLALVSTPAAAADNDDVLVEFHFQPVPNTQIAIWLVDANGQFVQDVFVTQATGTLGIGNRRAGASPTARGPRCCRCGRTRGARTTPR